ncbi:acetyl-CoA carboxylase biotin carboxyl carrier protein subunit [Sphingosinithalassobacter portus]|uniref:acetyl-CoA carboxylase biotin carboxyl carrier protein subunit n=1 Tax=Stakelama portus TaxID=2676234 RepID=UPI00137A3348|nr:biotin/lipoyl-containing protein [Sphingosinithalassobacter portus]
MTIHLEFDGEIHNIVAQQLKPQLTLVIDGVAHRIASLPPLGDGRHRMVFDGREITFARSEDGKGVTVRLDGRSFVIGQVDPFAADADGAAARDSVVAPMPGVVVSIDCAPGDTVAKGQALITIESMKLQQALAAPRDGIVAQIPGAAGSTFEKDAVLVQLEPVEGA